MAGPTRTRTRRHLVDLCIRALETPSARERNAAEKEAIRVWNRWRPQQRQLFLTHHLAFQQAAEEEEEARDQAWDLQERITEAEALGLPWLREQRAAIIQAHEDVLSAVRAYQIETLWLQSFFRRTQCPQTLLDLLTHIRDSAFGKRLALERGIRIWTALAAQEDGILYKERGLDLASDPPNSRLIQFLRHRQFDHNTIEQLIPEDARNRWQGPFPIYHASNGTLVTIWILVQTPARRIMRCIVRKDIDMTHCWSDVTRWEGDARDVHHRTPYEHSCHSALMAVETSSRPNLSNVLRLIHGGLNHNDQILTLYTELANYGSLADLIDAYNKMNSVIPEAFIWFCFWSLAEAGLAMQYGRVTAQQPADGSEEAAEPEWQEIVHSDIKPSNIFLVRNTDAGWFPLYPAPKLGDFGHAFKTFAGDPANPALHANGLGTAGYRAPEQCRWWDERTHHPVERYKLGAHTNLYAIGLVIRSLILAVDEGIATDLKEQGRGVWARDQRVTLRALYSEDLLRLVDACIQPRPQDRISFRHLHNQIMAVISGPVQNVISWGRLLDTRVLRDPGINGIDDATHNRNTIFRTAEMFGNDFRPEPAGDLRFRVGQPFVNRDGLRPPFISTPLRSLYESDQIQRPVGYWTSYAYTRP